MSLPLLEQLIEAFRVLPGVGQKTAQRMAYHVLERARDGGQRLSEVLAEAIEKIGHCKQCRDFSETELCPVCASSSRERQMLCVIESPADRLAIEHATSYRGVYYVLQGRLSPLDGIGPDDLNIKGLVERVATGEIKEVILAVNATVEGQTTAHYITDQLSSFDVRVTRLAHGVPVGGELDYLDEGTLAAALRARTTL